MNLEHLAKTIKGYRKKNNLTQQELAEKLKISRTTLSYYETASVEPNIYILINLANELDCSLESLLGYNLDSEKTPSKIEKSKIEKFNELNFYVNEAKKTLSLIKKTYSDLNITKKRLNKIISETSGLNSKLNKIISETSGLDSKLNKIISETSGLDSKLNKSLSKLNDLDSRENKIDNLVKKINDINLNTLNIKESDLEISNEIAPSVEDLRNEKLIDWEKQYKKNKDYKNITCINKYGNVAAGLPSFACEEVEKFLYLPQKYFSPAYDYFALTINGDSMNKLYEDGEVIIVRKQNYAYNGEIIIACILGEATCKEYYFNEDEDKHELIPHSTNPKHKPQLYSDDEIMILGIVECSLNKILDKEIN
ncbi:helix-turn-helix domain-containing protein [Clostridium perfringens]|uniref:helix-turn-helix domain-containing protein n=1 Tax=Clostridium perfringens TaxID=1502 RepID=UPI0024BD06B2|nr:S24 family peptidase [Clostridium perfringens]